MASFCMERKKNRFASIRKKESHWTSGRLMMLGSYVGYTDTLSFFLVLSSFLPFFPFILQHMRAFTTTTHTHTLSRLNLKTPTRSKYTILNQYARSRSDFLRPDGISKDNFSWLKRMKPSLFNSLSALKVWNSHFASLFLPFSLHRC